MLSALHCFSLTDLGEIHPHNLIPSHACLWLLWLSCIKWEYMSGSKSWRTSQPHRGSVPKQDSSAPSSSYVLAFPWNQQPGTWPWWAFLHLPASAPSTSKLSFNYFRTKFSKLQYAPEIISAAAHLAPRGRAGSCHLKGCKRSWGNHSVPCISDNYKGRGEESNYLKTIGN